MKIFEQKDESLTHSLNYEGVCKTAPATKGLLKTINVNYFITGCKTQTIQKTTLCVFWLKNLVCRKTLAFIGIGTKYPPLWP